MFSTPGWDQTLFEIINQTGHNPVFDFLMPIFSDKLLLWVIGAALLVWAGIKKRKRFIIRILVILLAIILSDIGCNMLKDSFGRVRPLNAHANVYFMEDGKWEQRASTFEAKKRSGNSYPSAHSSNTMAIAFLAMVFWPKLRPWLGLFPFIVGYSRIYLGKHYPTDVLFGWLFGMAVVIGLWIIWQSISHKLPDDFLFVSSK